jgi:general secretion pathway protein E
VLKALAGMQVSESRLPQAGRLRHAGDGRSPIDFRVSSLPAAFGEKIVLRRWEGGREAPRLADLGLSQMMLERVRGFGAQPRGLVLVVGPAGSGVRTTLAALTADAAERRAGRDEIVTVEDPIAYRIPGVTQTSVDAAGGERVASRLRSVVQQGPAVVVVGDLSDAETAGIALSAAEDALVITTVRADDLASAVAGLLTLGLEPAVVASRITGGVVQRLSRRVCAACRRPRTPAADERRRLGWSAYEPVTVFEPAGCAGCHHTGYRGRVGVFEAIAMSAAARKVIAGHDPALSIDEVVRREGGASLLEDALSKVRAGVIALSELTRVVGGIDGGWPPRPLCAACGAAVSEGFLACPSCGATIGGGCACCGRALRPGWRDCPYCAGRAEASARQRDGNRPRGRTVVS